MTRTESDESIIHLLTVKTKKILFFSFFFG